ncbi:MAG: DUF4221 domain-containing protein [Bacteroidales bacterium]|jgi:hypothetical protein|nr:DUF4221 domain-containing protein [Bacteroidales bacterium]
MKSSETEMKYKMKYKIIALLIISLLIFVSSCNKGKIYNDILIKTREVEFRRDKNVKEFVIVKFLTIDSTNLIVHLDIDVNKLYYYSLNSGELVKELKIPYRRKISDFWLNNMSSIYFIPQYSSQILKYDNDNTIDTIIFFTPNDLLKFDLGHLFEFLPTVLSQLYIKDSTYYVTNTFPEQGFLEEHRPFLIIDKNKINTKIGRFPKEIIIKGKTFFPFNLFPSFTINEKKNQITIVYNTDNNLYVYNDTVLIKKISCKSAFVTNLPKPINQLKNDEFNSEKINLRGLEFDFYAGIYYDNYNNLYYRTVKLKNNSMNDLEDYNFSIMILDENFNIIGEQLFNAKDYDFTSLLVTKEGVLLRKIDDLSGISRYTTFRLNSKYIKQ